MSKNTVIKKVSFTLQKQLIYYSKRIYFTGKKEQMRSCLRCYSAASLCQKLIDRD